jgi:hypothetical protein
MRDEPFEVILRIVAPIASAGNNAHLSRPVDLEPLALVSIGAVIDA